MNQIYCILFASFFSVTGALSQSRFADFPFGENNSTSPDGTFTLKTEDCQLNPIKCDRRLWMVNNRTLSRKLLIDVQGTARVGWAPSGSAFFLNDDFASDMSGVHLYFPAEDRHFDLGALLDQKFPQDRHFEDGSHHYINGVRWIDADTVLVKRFGHFDRYVPGGNEFAVCYEVSKAGGIKRLFETHKESSSCQTP
jgi:hypothetical protein